MTTPVQKKTVRLTLGELKKLIKESVNIVDAISKQKLEEATPPPVPTDALVKQLETIYTQMQQLTAKRMADAKAGKTQEVAAADAQIKKLRDTRNNLEAKFADMSNNPFAKVPTAAPAVAPPAAAPAV